MWHKHWMIIKTGEISFESYLPYRPSCLVGKFHWHHLHTNFDFKWRGQISESKVWEHDHALRVEASNTLCYVMYVKVVLVMTNMSKLSSSSCHICI